MQHNNKLTATGIGKKVISVALVSLHFCECSNFLLLGPGSQYLQVATGTNST